MALNVGELAATLSLDDDKFNRGMDNADNKTSKLGKVAGVAGAAVAGAMVAAGTAAVGFGYKAVMAGSDLSETMSKSSNVFKASAGEIEKWSQTSAKSFGQSRTEALEAASTFGNLFVQLGTGADESAKVSMQMTELASDFASFHNAAPVDVIDAMTAAFRGEYDAVQRYVPTINAAAVEQKALEMTGKATTKELTAQEKALATQTLLMQGAGDAAGDFDRTSDGLANRLRIAKASAADFAANVGEKMIPVLMGAWDQAEKLAPVIGEGLKGAFEGLGNVLSPVGDGLKQFFGNAGNYSMKELLQAGQAEEDMSGFQKSIQAFGEGVRTVFGEPGQYSIKELFNAGGAEEDMNLVQQAIANFGTVWQTAYDTVSGILDSLKEYYATVFGEVQEWLTNNQDKVQEWQDKFAEIQETIGPIWESIVEIIKGALGFIGDVVTGFVDGLKWVWENFGQNIMDVVGGAFSWILDVIKGALDIVKGIFDVFIGLFTGDWGRMWDGIKSILGGAWDIIKSTVQFALDFLKSILDIAGKALTAAWDWLWSTIKNAASSAWNGIVDFVRGGIDRVVGLAKGIGGSISDAVGGAFDSLKTGFKAVVNWLIEKWNNLSFEVPGADVPGLGKVGGFRLDTPNIPMLAEGGRVVGAGLAIVGEAGPELVRMNAGASVVPLPAQNMAGGPQVIIEEINLNGVRDFEGVQRALPELRTAIAAGVGRR